MLIKNKGVLWEKFQEIEVATNKVKLTIRSHNVSSIFWESEGILNELALTIVMKDFVSVNELSLLLKEVHSR